MTTKNRMFRDVLKLSSGAQWLKADLHIHTPASNDFKGDRENTTPHDIVNAAIKKELDVIAITDHNTVDWCDKVRSAAKGKNLVVFPGVEVSTKEGHVLAIFDVDASIDKMKDFLVTVKILSSQFGDLEHSSEFDFEETLDAIAEFGGVAIAAHPYDKRGFLKMIAVPQHRKSAYQSNNLWAIEINDSESRDEHMSGKLYPPRRMTCLQFSDSHDLLEDMGKRSTFLKMGERNLGGLKLALLDPDIRVRFDEDELPTPECTILGMWVTNGFLDSQKIRFNDGVNCLIGDTGSGKSLSIELIRFALDQQPVVPKIQREVNGLLEHQLRDTGVVHVLLRKGASRYLVERSWGEPPSAPFVQGLDGDGGASHLTLSDIQDFFPIKCFSQSEIIEFARDNRVRLSLTDDLIDISDEIDSIESLKGKLRHNAAAITSEEEKAAATRKQVARRAGLIDDLSRVDRVLPLDRIKEQALWYKEQKMLEDANDKISNLRGGLGDAISRLKQLPVWGKELDGLPNKESLAELENSFQAWTADVAKAQQELEDRLEELIKSNSFIRRKWSERFENKEADYRASLEMLDATGMGYQALAEHRKGIQGQITVLDEKEVALKEQIKPRIAELKEEREHLLNELQRFRRLVTGKRVSKASDLTAKLKDNVRLRVHARQDKDRFIQLLTNIAQGSRLGAQNVELLCQSHPVPFVKKLLNNDFDDLANTHNVQASRLEALWNTILEREKLSDLYELQLVDVDDTIEVQLEVQQGNYKNLEELSHGQKCRVVLMVALAEGDFPLLVDQPEDALHAPGIEEGIVSNLRNNRGARQCIFATRNANILVSADSEQIIALEADAENGRVKSTGSLDSYNHKRLVIYHVEGGRKAFSRRNAMYTLRQSIDVD